MHVRCTSCSASHFVYPRGAWPPPPDEAPPAAAPKGASWFVPLLAGGISLGVVAVALLILLGNLLSRDPGNDERNSDDNDARSQKIDAVLSQGRSLLGNGGFSAAHKLFEEAAAGGLEHPDLARLQREADLLAHLSLLKLQDIVARAQAVRAEVWEDEWAKFRGASIVFDDLVRRDQTGFQLVHLEVEAGNEKALLLFPPDLFPHPMEMPQPQRLLFGARLHDMQRERGQWIIRFESGSGVLLTEEDSARALGFRADEDPLLPKLLREQMRWATQAPVQRGRP